MFHYTDGIAAGETLRDIVTSQIDCDEIYLTPYTPVMASVTVVFVLLAALIFGLIGRFGDLPRLLGALNPEEKQ